jgi:uncharacterized membrane protein YidH (DUF202 family)
MKVIKPVIRSLVISLVIAVAVLSVATLSKTSTDMTLEELESVQTMTSADAMAFIYEHQSVKRGGDAFREFFLGYRAFNRGFTDFRRDSPLTSRTFLSLTICGFVSCLIVVGWNNRKQKNTTDGNGKGERLRVVRTVVRSLIISLVIAGVVLFVHILSNNVSYGSDMTPEERKSVQSMTFADANAFGLEHRVVKRGWVGADLRRSFSSALASRSFLYLAMCGFVSSLAVMGWSNRKPEKPNGGSQQ